MEYHGTDLYLTLTSSLLEVRPGQKEKSEAAFKCRCSLVEATACARRNMITQPQTHMCVTSLPLQTPALIVLGVEGPHTCVSG